MFIFFGDLMETINEFKEYMKMKRKGLLKLLPGKRISREQLSEQAFEQIKILVAKNPNITKTELNFELSKFTGYSPSWIINFLDFLVYKNKIKISLTGNKNQRRIEIVEEPNPTISE